MLKLNLRVRLHRLIIGFPIGKQPFGRVIFFHVDEYPEMTFSSNSIRKIDDGVYELTGDLTLLETTKEVTVTMVHRGTIANPMADGAPVAGIQITATIDRSDFNLGNGFPPPMISNEVRIKADGEFAIQ